MSNKMDAIAKSNIRYIPSLNQTEAEPKQTPLWLRVTNAVGLTMANAQDPKGWSWNPATITLMLVIMSMVAAGAYYMGNRDANDRHLIERLDKAEKSAAQAEKLAIAAAAGDKGPGHPEPTPKEPKK